MKYYEPALAAYEQLSTPTRDKLGAWIRATIAPAAGIYPYNSYSIKHDAEQAIGEYIIRNDEFKGAMLACGFEPIPSTADKANWKFRIKSKIPQSERPPRGQRGFGGFLRAERTSKGVGLRELARKVGISAPYLSQVEHGIAAPPAEDKLAALAAELNLSPDLVLAEAGRVPADVLAILKQKPLPMNQLVRAACKAWAGPGDPAGPAHGIALRVDAHGLARCGDIPLISAAWNALPAELRLPCDPEHLVVIRDYDAFLKTHPDLAANATLRERARQAFAFTITAAWPVYINLGPHQSITGAFDRSPWIAFAIAGVLVHERVHAMGNLSEAAGLQAEFQLDQRFQSEGKLPEAFDIRGLERQYRDALNQESGLRSSRPAQQEQRDMRIAWTQGAASNPSIHAAAHARPAACEWGQEQGAAVHLVNDDRHI
jgi:transcriptional regulator with XRE-family HTH domain